MQSATGAKYLAQSLPRSLSLSTYILEPAGSLAAGGVASRLSHNGHLGAIISAGRHCNNIND
jgi:hypothetical protein